MKMLNGSELAGFIKERQARSARALRQAAGIIPTLAIVRTNSDPVVDIYLKLKKNYGEDIGVDVRLMEVDQKNVRETIRGLNGDAFVHGIIVQLPLADPAETEEVVNLVAPEKDVDGLAENTIFDASTPTAINWLLAGYNINLPGKKIVIVGQGRLVGDPLASMWRSSELDVATADISTEDLKGLLQSADIIVSATGHPALITSDMVKEGAVIVDAGVATDKNGLVGDVADDVRSREDIAITPVKGGVGPLTVAALFENVLSAARNQSVLSS